MTSPSPHPTRRSRPWSALVVVALGVILVAVGILGRLGQPGQQGYASPAPGLTERPPSPVTSPSRAGPARTAGALGPLTAIGEVVVDRSHDAEQFEGLLYQPIGVLASSGTYVFQLVCSGPGELVIVDDAGSVVDPALFAECDGTPVSRDIALSGPSLDMNARASLAAAWRVIVSSPAVPTPAVTAPPAVAPLVPAPSCASSAELASAPALSVTVGSGRHAGMLTTTTWNGVRVDRSLDLGLLPAIRLERAAEIRIAGDACPLAWRIEAQRLGVVPDPQLGQTIVLSAGAAPSAGAARPTVTAFPIDGLSPGQWIVRANVAFAQGSETSVWRVNAVSFLFGRGRLTARNASVTGLAIGCPSFAVTGADSADECGPIGWPIDAAPAFRITGDVAVRFAIPGWASEITASATTAAGARAAERTRQPPADQRVVAVTGDRLDVPFGDVAVLVAVDAARPDAEFTTAYLFHVIHVRG